MTIPIVKHKAKPTNDPFPYISPGTSFLEFLLNLHPSLFLGESRVLRFFICASLQGIYHVAITIQAMKINYYG